MVKLVDTSALGADARKGMEVQILSRAPTSKTNEPKFWQNYFLGKGFAKTSAHLFWNLDVANGKGGVWGGIFHLLLFLFWRNLGQDFWRNPLKIHLQNCLNYVSL